WASQQSSLSYLSPRRFGFSSFSGAASDGDLEQDVSFYGREAGFSYALDGQARRLVLQQPNGQLEQFSLDARMQERLTDSDTLYVSLGGMRDERGDVASYYDPNSANRDLHVVETQEPSLFAGYHHEWSTESHTLALVSFTSDRLQLDNAKPGMFFLQQSGGEIVSVRTMPFLEQDLDSRFSLATAEAQQIWSTDRHQLVAGARFQGGWINSDSTLTQLTRTLDSADVTATMERAGAYAYYQWDPVAWIRLSGGVSYDALWYPTSVDLPPLSGQRETETQWSPKAALTLYPWKGGQFRGVYAQSLGGLYFDNSIRLEPGQIGGFTQLFRSLIPESVAGLVPGTTFETAGVAYDQVLDSGTYFGAEAVQLDSDGSRQVGAFTNSTPLPLPNELFALTEDLHFLERTVTGYVSQLIGQSWTLGVRGSLSRAELDTGYPGLPPTTPGLDQLNTEQTATLGRVQMSVRYQHPRGWFAEGFGTWYHQSNGGADADLPGDSFWQGNVFVGFRWPRQIAELRFGILNLSDQDYRLNPLNLLNAPPRTRTFVASLQFNL
ncbi:MAG: TonB-dependent receptor, partial [Verrucomicrobiales bacterium]|nr:TonB-dependent receptor [Verrucomicrobiales bacterium]